MLKYIADFKNLYKNGVKKVDERAKMKLMIYHSGLTTGMKDKLRKLTHKYAFIYIQNGDFDLIFNNEKYTKRMLIVPDFVRLPKEMKVY